jgi:hypothetical protein
MAAATSSHSYQSLPFEGFQGGLNLLDKVDAIKPSEACDLRNVLFTQRGTIESRPGFNNLTPSELTNRVESLSPYYTASGTKQLVAGCGSRLETISTAGSVVASATGLSGGIWDFCRFGKPNEEAVYAGNGLDATRKWDGSNWTAPTVTVDGAGAKTGVKASSLCILPAYNRLVFGGFSGKTSGPGGAESSPSHVWFSEEGNPEAFESTAYIQFTPGDGEKVLAVVTWREFVFVFKETKFFVITDQARDTENKPEFVFQTIETGVGLASPRAVCIHQSGVYFMGRGGVYRTTGSEPEQVSNAVEPIWSGDISLFYKGGTLAFSAINNCAMETWDEKIYLTFPTNEAANRQLVYSPEYKWWSLSDLPASCFATFRVENETELVFGYSSGEKMIGRHKTSYTNDDGKAIVERWRSGWFDLGSADVKKVRAAKVWGTGRVTMEIDKDFQESSGKAEALDLSGSTGTIFGGAGVFGGEGFFGDLSAGLVGKERRIAQRGTTMSVLFTNEVLDQEFTIHRNELLVPGLDEPSRIQA